MSCLSEARELHFVLKISNRLETINFYRNLLLMKCLRHEEFDEGCKASCNGPYNNKWSKTMIGYGDEDLNFVLELTYNYAIRDYKIGNDLNYIQIESTRVLENIKKSSSYSFKLLSNKIIELNDPNGYKFIIKESNQERISKVSLFSTNLDKTKKYWNEILGMKIVDNDGTRNLEETKDSIELSYSELFKLEFKLLNVNLIDHKTSFGRIAFSCKTNELSLLQNRINQLDYKILTPLVSLDTPGKQTVYVIILADVDNHEICFVGDEGFRELSKIDINADKLLNDSIEKDKSDEWHWKQQNQMNINP
jgi:catechol 2,3-dioxygenase-like lactoylglutathione lyase family enzyme